MADATTVLELVGACTASMVTLPTGIPVSENAPLASATALNTSKVVRLVTRTTAPARGVPSGASASPTSRAVPSMMMSTLNWAPARIWVLTSP